jgi:hypothetical protein
MGIFGVPPGLWCADLWAGLQPANSVLKTKNPKWNGPVPNREAVGALVK